MKSILGRGAPVDFRTPVEQIHLGPPRKILVAERAAEGKLCDQRPVTIATCSVVLPVVRPLPKSDS